MHLYRVLFVDTLTFLHQVFNYLNHDEVLDCCLRSALSKTADGRRRWLGAISDPFLWTSGLCVEGSLTHVAAGRGHPIV